MRDRGREMYMKTRAKKCQQKNNFSEPVPKNGHVYSGHKSALYTRVVKKTTFFQIQPITPANC